jgi:hypothetical protein
MKVVEFSQMRMTLATIRVGGIIVRVGHDKSPCG